MTSQVVEDMAKMSSLGKAQWYKQEWNCVSYEPDISATQCVINTEKGTAKSSWKTDIFALFA